MARLSVILVGAETLLGKEVRERFKDVSFTARLTSATLDATVLAQGEEEIEVVQPLDEDMLVEAKAVILASNASAVLARIRSGGSEAAVIDLTGELENEPDSRVRSPIFESKTPTAAIHVVPHPAAYALALLLNDLAESGAPAIRRAVITIFEPASQSGTAALQELQQQTVNLLAFKSLPKEYFDAQLAFSMLARTGMDAKISLGPREQQIERHLASLLVLQGGGIPMPSLRLVQAPVFHGYTASIWIEFQNRPVGLLELLQRQSVNIFPEDPPSNASVTEIDGYALGAVEADRNVANAYWFWLGADNLRLPASVAIDILREML